MFRRAYILTYNSYDFENNSFHNTLTNAKGIINWWHYISGNYILIVESNITAINISDYILKIAPDKKFFVCELNLKNHNGWLPNAAWDWINNQTSKL